MTLTRNAGASVLQVAVSGVCLFVLYRYLARVMGPSTIGLWSIVLSGANAMRLADMGISGTTVKFVASDVGGGRLAEARQSVAMALLVAGMVVGLALLTIGWFAPDILHRFLKDRAIADEALAILPTVLLSAWIATGAGVMLGALDGLQRIDLRAAIASTGAVAQVATTWSLVPELGLRGIAIGHFAQSMVTFLLAALAVRIKLGPIFGLQRTWNASRLRTMLVYGGGLQLSAIAQMLFEPIVRGMLAHYGTLALTGYYEMANRLVYQARSVLVAGYQALIPHVALVHSRLGIGPIRGIYMDSYHLLAEVSIPYFSLVLAALPLVSCLWLGRVEPALLLMGMVAVVMWAANAMIVPAYYVLLGLGRPRWISISQIVTTAVNAVLALPLGRVFGGYGVAIGSCLAVIFGSASVIFGLHREQNIPLARLRPHVNFATLASAVLGVGVCCAPLVFNLGTSEFFVAFAAFLGAIVVVGYLQFLAGWNVARLLAQIAGHGSL